MANTLDADVDVSYQSVTPAYICLKALQAAGIPDSFINVSSFNVVNEYQKDNNMLVNTYFSANRKKKASDIIKDMLTLSLCYMYFEGNVITITQWKPYYYNFSFNDYLSMPPIENRVYDRGTVIEGKDIVSDDITEWYEYSNYKGVLLPFESVGLVEYDRSKTLFSIEYNYGEYYKLGNSPDRLKPASECDIILSSGAANNAFYQLYKYRYWDFDILNAPVRLKYLKLTLNSKIFSLYAGSPSKARKAEPCTIGQSSPGKS